MSCDGIRRPPPIRLNHIRSRAFLKGGDQNHTDREYIYRRVVPPAHLGLPLYRLTILSIYKRKFCAVENMSEMLLPPPTDGLKLNPACERENFAHVMDALSTRQKNIPYTLNALVDISLTTAFKTLDEHVS